MPQYKVVRSEYKGRPVMSITLADGGYPITFGLEKAKRILECIGNIREFVKWAEKRALYIAAEKKARQKKKEEVNP